MSVRIALVWPGTATERLTATADSNRLRDVFEALAQAGADVQPAVYSDEIVREVQAQLLGVDGAIVFVNPITDGRDRSALDPMLREVAASGVWVSTHPDVILKLGTKEILHRTQHFSWGSECRLYRSHRELREQLPATLAAGAPRVLKQNRGNGGQGVWKVTRVDSNAETVEVQHAVRGSMPERLSLASLLERFQAYFAGEGRMIDQAYQPRLPDGMIRCYMVQERVAGFGHQLIKALLPPSPDGPEPGPRIMSGAENPQFQRLRHAMETEWVPALQRLLEIETESLPVIWDADFLYGPKTRSGEDTYVLCEINVSCVFPFPDEALQPLAAAALKSAGMRQSPRSRTLPP